MVGIHHMTSFGDVGWSTNIALTDQNIERMPINISLIAKENLERWSICIALIAQTSGTSVHKHCTDWSKYRT